MNALLLQAARLWREWAVAASWQVALMVLLVALAALAARRLSARFRYLLWLLVFLKIFTPPSLSPGWGVGNWAVSPAWRMIADRGLRGLASPGTADSPGAGRGAQGAEQPIADFGLRIADVENPLNAPAFTSAALPASPPVLISQTGISNLKSEIPAPHAAFRMPLFSLTQWLALAWLAGAAVFFLVILLRYLRMLRRLREACEVDEGPLRILLERLSLRLGAAAPPPLLLSDQVCSPFLLGVLHPRIVLPAGLPAELAPAELEDVLLHELMHWRRRDLAVAWLQVLAHGLFWFHPLVWMAGARLRHERECACDEAVLASGCSEPRRYGHALLQVLLASRGRSPVALGFLGVFERNTLLQRRLEEIMNQTTRSKRFGWGSRLFILLFTLCVLPMTPVNPRSQTASSGSAVNGSPLVAGSTGYGSATLSTGDGQTSSVMTIVTTDTDNPNSTAITIRSNPYGGIQLSPGDSPALRLQAVPPVHTNGTAITIRSNPGGTVVVTPGNGLTSSVVERSTGRNNNRIMTIRRSTGGGGGSFSTSTGASGGGGGSFSISTGASGGGGGSFSISTGTPGGGGVGNFSTGIRLTTSSVGNGIRTITMRSSGGAGPMILGSTLMGQYPISDADKKILNQNQQLYLDWVDSHMPHPGPTETLRDPQARNSLEAQSLAALERPNGNGVPEAICALGELKSRDAVGPLLKIATDRRDTTDNTNRWLAVRALGLIGDKSAIPGLIPLVYHYDLNVRLWAQISLARLTGQNFGYDWRMWGQWWNNQGAGPAFVAEPVQWATRDEAKKTADPARQQEDDQRLFQSLRQVQDSLARAQTQMKQAQEKAQDQLRAQQQKMQDEMQAQQQRFQAEQKRLQDQLQKRNQPPDLSQNMQRQLDELTQRAQDLAQRGSADAERMAKQYRQRLDELNKNLGDEARKGEAFLKSGEAEKALQKMVEDLQAKGQDLNQKIGDAVQQKIQDAISRIVKDEVDKQVNAALAQQGLIPNAPGALTAPAPVPPPPGYPATPGAPVPLPPGYSTAPAPTTPRTLPKPATRPNPDPMQKAKANLQSFASTLEAFKADIGRYPTTAEDLSALIRRPAAIAPEKWRGPYINTIPRDPWGGEYQYACPGVKHKDGYDLISAGPDRKFGTPDDLDDKGSPAPDPFF